MPTWFRGLAILLLLVTPGCEEENTTLVTDIGIAGLVLTDPDVAPQSIIDPEASIQVVVWELGPPAELIRGDGVMVDLLFGEHCQIIQTVDSGFNPTGRCADGIVLGSSESSESGEIPVELLLTVESMELRRAKPVNLQPEDDYDGDGLANAVDNCPLMPNKDQADSNGDGIGDTCTTFDLFGQPVRDSDGDGVADPSDNCVWIPNPGQEDTMGIAAEYGIPDGIGDACEEQTAFVMPTPAMPIVFEAGELTAGLVLATGGLSFITVDFDDAVDLESCDWNGNTCDPLVKASVELCGIQSSISLALGGCGGS